MVYIKFTKQLRFFYILVLSLLIAFNAKAQSVLTFNKRFVLSEDKWIAFKQGKDSSHMYGFIYIDPQAGLTLNYQGHFKIDEGGTFIPGQSDSINMKVRLQPNNVLVAWIPAHKFLELKIEPEPEWLKSYKKDTTSAEHLYRWGYMYNGWGLCSKALTYLERAQTINPEFRGLNNELAFSYNCLGEYKKTIQVLISELEKNPTDAYAHKELIYAQINLGRLDLASESCRRALNVCKDTTYNGENCYNLLYNFYLKKDQHNFKLWLTETEKWTKNNSRLTKSIAFMKNEMLK